MSNTLEDVIINNNSSNYNSETSSIKSNDEQQTLYDLAGRSSKKKDPRLSRLHLHQN